MLRVETMKNVSKLQNEKSLVLSMKAKVKQLQEEQAEREQNRLKELVRTVNSGPLKCGP